MLDRLRAESGEQRLVDRADPPCAEDQRHKLGDAWQHAGHDIAGADAELLEQGADAARHVGEVVEGIFAQFAAGRDGAQRQPVLAGIAAAAFDIGVDAGGRIAVKPGDLILDTELRNGILIARQRSRLGHGGPPLDGDCPKTWRRSIAAKVDGPWQASEVALHGAPSVTAYAAS